MDEKFQVGCSEILPIASVATNGDLPTIVGGQAVNIFAEYYRAKIAEKLRPFEPFVSKDLDLFGNLGMLEGLGRHFGVPVRLAEPRLPVIGMMFVQRAVGEPIKVELIRNVKGLTQWELDDILQISLQGRLISVLTPVMCLKAKLSNAADLDQTGRQDVKHIKIIAVCANEYAKELLRGEIPGKSERGILTDIQQLHTVINSDNARKVQEKWNVSVSEVLPIEELQQCTLPKIRRFVENLHRRLP